MLGGCKGGSEVKSTYCSCRDLNSVLITGIRGLSVPVTSVPGELMRGGEALWHLHSYAHTPLALHIHS